MLQAPAATLCSRGCFNGAVTALLAAVRAARASTQVVHCSQHSMEDVGESIKLQSLERRVSEIAMEVSTQVSLALASWHEKEAQLLRMFQSQQEELHQLRVHCCLSQQRSSSALDVSKAPAAGESPAAVGSHACSSLQQEVVAETSTLLKELKDERCIVSEMLDNVKQEKCEVIAMMHMFVTAKNEAMEELDGLRHAARDEISAFVVHARSSVSAATTVTRGRHSEVTSARSDGREAADHERPTEPVQIASVHGGRRAGSHSTLLPAASQAPAMQLLTRPHVGQQQPSGTSGVAVATVGPASVTAPGVTASGRDQRRHSTGVVPAEPSVQSSCSPARQKSAGVSMTRVLSVNTACSPPMLPRPAVATAETLKSPVRRFYSGSPAQAGVQELLGRGPSISASWTTMSQGPLIR